MSGECDKCGEHCLDCLCNEKELIVSKFDEFTPKQGNYDIHFVIELLKQIEDRCTQYRFQPKDLQLSMWQSSKSLRVKLEMERDFHKNKVKSYRCDHCNEMYFVPEFNKDICPHCEAKSNTKKISNF